MDQLPPEALVHVLSFLLDPRDRQRWGMTCSWMLRLVEAEWKGLFGLRDKEEVILHARTPLVFSDLVVNSCTRMGIVHRYRFQIENLSISELRDLVLPADYTIEVMATCVHDRCMHSQWVETLDLREIYRSLQKQLTSACRNKTGGVCACCCRMVGRLQEGGYCEDCLRPRKWCPKCGELWAEHDGHQHYPWPHRYPCAEQQPTPWKAFRIRNRHLLAAQLRRARLQMDVD